MWRCCCNSVSNFSPGYPLQVFLQAPAAGLNAKKAFHCYPAACGPALLFSAYKKNTRKHYLGRRGMNDAGIKRYTLQRLIFFVKLLCYLLNRYAKLFNNASYDKRFTIRHKVHVLRHVYVFYQAFASNF